MVSCPHLLLRYFANPAVWLLVGLATSLPFAQADCLAHPDWLDRSASDGFRWQGTCPAAKLDQAEARLQLRPHAYVELIGATQPATRLRCENDSRKLLTLSLQKADQGMPWQQRIRGPDRYCHWQEKSLQCPSLSRWPTCVVESRKSPAALLSLNAAVQLKALPALEPNEAERMWLDQRQVVIDYCHERFASQFPGELIIQLPLEGGSTGLQVSWLPTAGQHEPTLLLQCLQSRLRQGPSAPETGRVLRMPWTAAKP